MILPIVKYPAPVLRTKGKMIPQITEKIRQLAQDMIETMRDANGVGLAAQQVGEALQMMVLDIPEMDERPSTMALKGKPSAMADWMPMTLINPQLILGKEREIGIEGCLSFPDINEDILRPISVVAKGQLLDGTLIEFEASGLFARALQHEADHLNGVLFIDRMNSATKSSLAGKLKRMR